MDDIHSNIYTATYKTQDEHMLYYLSQRRGKMARNLSVPIPGLSQSFLSLVFQRLINLGKWRQFCVIFDLHLKIAFRKKKKEKPMKPEIPV